MMEQDRYNQLLSGGGTLAPQRCYFSVIGADRLRYLNGQLSNQVGGSNNSVYALALNAKGHLEADLFIHDLGERFIIDAAPELRESLPARLGKYIIADDVEIDDETDLWELRHEFLGQEPENSEPGKSTLRYGIPGKDFLSAIGTATEQTVTEAEGETLRILGGTPKWGAELTTGMLPPDAGETFIARCINYEKGCYTGQEVISRMRRSGKSPRCLVSLLPEEPISPDADARIFDEGGKEIGIVTSTCLHPPLDHHAALGYVRTASMNVEEEFFIRQSTTSPPTKTKLFSPGNITPQSPSS